MLSLRRTPAIAVFAAALIWVGEVSLTAKAFSPASLSSISRLQASNKCVSSSCRRSRHGYVSPSMASSTEETLTPPGRSGGILGIYDSLKLISDPLGFVKKWQQRHGAVFMTTQFFRPTLVLGDPDAVTEFVEKEDKITALALPETFQELHTEYSSLNQDGDRLKATRIAMQGILSSSKFEEYLPEIERQIDVFVDDLAKRGESQLSKDQIDLFIALFGGIFSGRTISSEEIQMLKDYNAGLLSLGKWDPNYKKAKAAFEALVAANRKALDEARARSFSGSLDGVWAALTESVEETGEKWSDERCAVVSVLFTWGAYAELASMCSFAVLQLAQQPGIADLVRQEASEAGMLGGSAPPGLQAWSRLPYTDAVLKEVLRYHSQTGGGFRATAEDIEIAGFKIAAGTVVSPDTRVPNFNPEIHPEPETFEPARWLTAQELPAMAGQPASKCPFTGAAASLPTHAFFPGGTGSHQCPGLPLAQLVGRVFLVKWVDKFASWAAEDPSKPVPMVEIPIRYPAEEFTIKLTPRV